MKLYPKTFENIMVTEDRINGYNKSLLSSATSSLEVDELVGMLRESFVDYSNALFKFVLKYEWVRRNLLYDGAIFLKRPNRGKSKVPVSAAFTNFELGRSTGHILASSPFFQALSTYIDDLFPDFNIHSPFECDYEFPFKHMTIECLFVVCELEDRMEMLRYGESHLMSYSEFVDWVTNYVCSFNEEHGTTYTMKQIYGVWQAINMKLHKKYEQQYRDTETG